MLVYWYFTANSEVNKIFRGSSAVEQFPVKELVVGSIPTHGASKIADTYLTLYVSCVTNYKVVSVNQKRGLQK